MRFHATLIAALALCCAVLPARAVTIQVIEEGNSVQVTVGPFTTEAGVGVAPATITETLDTLPAGDDSTNLWLATYTAADVSDTYYLVSVIPYTSWAIPAALRDSSRLLDVRFSYCWAWEGPGADLRQGCAHADKTILRREFPRATPTP